MHSTKVCIGTYPVFCIEKLLKLKTMQISLSTLDKFNSYSYHLMFTNMIVCIYDKQTPLTRKEIML